MMKPVIPPVGGALHKALSEGCGMWSPALPRIGKTNQAARQVEAQVVMDDAPPLAESGSGETSAATAAGISP